MQHDRSAAGRALNAFRQRAPGVCIRCGAEFPASYAGKNARRYCSQACRQYAYMERKAEQQNRPAPAPPDRADG